MFTISHVIAVFFYENMNIGTLKTVFEILWICEHDVAHDEVRGTQT